MSKTFYHESYLGFQTLKECYNSLYDDVSKTIYWGRLTLDFSFDPEIVDSICALSNGEHNFSSGYDTHALVERIQDKSPIFIYGAGLFGRQWCEFLQQKKANLIGFYDRNYADLKNIMGFPVLPPPKTCNDNYFILISPYDYLDEIKNYLLSIGFIEDHILVCYSRKKDYTEYQYFDFPHNYIGNGAFVDAGCFDCDTSLRFARWCRGNYSKIFAFEPDEANLLRCRDNAKKYQINNIEFYRAALYNRTGKTGFRNHGTSSSQISEVGDATIQLVTLDEIVKDTTVSFIKMDIEGAELAALQGAEQTIKRDKPLCALSVYHRPGDMIILMQYLKLLVPEYKFALRHYSNMVSETVLYAFVEKNV